jgi:hypothetical protein
MTTNIEVARQAKAPGAVTSRGPGEPLQPRPASRQRDAILIVILLAAAARSARQAKAPGSVIWRGPGEPLQPQPIRRHRVAILFVILLAAEAELAPVAVFVIALAAIRGLVRESQIIPRVLTWYFGPISTWHNWRLKRHYLHQQRLDTPSG